VVLLGDRDLPRSSSERRRVIGRTGTRALIGQLSRDGFVDFDFDEVEDDALEVECVEPMVLGEKRSDNFRYFIASSEEVGWN